MPKPDALSKSSLTSQGMGNGSGNYARERILYPAIVVPNGTQDSSEQGRIRARIVSIDDTTGKIEGKKTDNQETYDSYSGLDRGIVDKDLVMCVPMFPQFFFVKPQVGEMVFIVMENPKDESATRYWIGPIITSKLKLKYQAYEDSVSVFDKTSFYSNKKIDGSSMTVEQVFPKDADVALQGRNDADLILKNREALLIAGKFNSQTYSVNTERPSYLRLRQVDVATTTQPTSKFPPATHNIVVQLLESPGEYTATIQVIYIKDNLMMEEEIDDSATRGDAIDFLKTKIKEYKEKYKQWNFLTSGIIEFDKEPVSYSSGVQSQALTPEQNNANNTTNKLGMYSEAELTSTSVLLYSTRGKYRNNEVKGFEINEDLKSFGALADSLHPAMFGDESIRLYDLIIRFLLNHIHQPQNPPLPDAVANELKTYTVEGKLQNLISNHVRLN